MSVENCVTLSIAGYNQIKAENTRFRMFMERMWEGTTLSKDKAKIIFDADLLSDVMHLVYPEQYKKKLSSLRRQATQEAIKKARELNGEVTGN